MSDWEDAPAGADDGWEEAGDEQDGFFSHAKKTLKNAAKDTTLVGAIPGLAEVVAGGIGDLGTAAVSGVYGPIKSMFSGHSAADEIIDTQEKIKNAIPYSPETTSGKAMYDVLGLLPEGIHAAGEKTFEKTGSPLLGAGLEVLGNAAMLGIPGMKKGKKARRVEDPVKRLEGGWEEAPEGYKGNTVLERQEAYRKYVEGQELEQAKKNTTQQELPLQNSLQDIAEMQGKAKGQTDLFGAQNAADLQVGKVSPHEITASPEGQAQLGFHSTPEEIAAKQALPEQRDMFLEDVNIPEQVKERMAAEAAQKEAMMAEPEAPRPEVSADVERAYAERQRQLEEGSVEERKAAREEELYAIQEALMEGRPIPKSNRRVPKGQRGALDIGAISEGLEKIKEKFKKFSVDVVPTNFSGSDSVMVKLTTPDGKTSGFVDFAVQPDGSLSAENAQVANGLRGHGAAQRMYLAAREAGYDISPGRVQTDLGNKMVDRLIDNGLINKNVEKARVSEHQARKMYVPQSQRGALLFGSPEPKGSKLSAATKDSPEIVAASQQLLKEKKQGMVKDVLNNPAFDAYTARMDTPEKVLAAAPEAKDIGPVQAAKANTGSPGMNSVAISSNNPLLKYTRDAIGKTVRATDQIVREYVTGPDGFGKKLEKLSQAEKNEVVGALQAADKKQRALMPDELAKAGFNDKQIDFIQHVQKMDQVKLGIWNKARTELGLPTVTAREGHFAGNFGGDYRTLVYDKNKNVVGVVTTNTALGNKAVQKKVLAKHPDVSFADTKRMSLAGSKAKANMFTGFADIMDVLAKGDPRFAKIQEVVDAAIKDRGDSLYGASLHAEAKKGIWGNEGNKFWKDANENTRDALKAFTEYWESGIASHLNLTTEVRLKELMDNPALDHMPRAKQYVDNYIKNYTGRSLGTVGDAINALIDTPGRWTGFGPTVVREAVQQFNKRASQFTMGAVNPLFLVTQYLQVPQMAFPELIKIQGSLGLPPTAVAEASAKAVANGLKIAKEELGYGKADVDSYTRDAYKYAKDNGLLSFSEFTNARDIFQNKYSKKFDKGMDFARERAEQSTRPYVFFSAAELLRESGLSPKEAFDTAYNITQHSMIDYHASEKPLMYSRLGVLGNAAGSLQTFKHAYLGQLGTLMNDAAKGRPGGLVAATIAMFTFSGIRGTPFYQELDELVKHLTDKFYKDRKSIADIALNKLPEWARSGVLSTSTGVNMQSRLSSADVLPNSPLEAVSPFGSWAGKIAQGVGDVAENNDKLAWSNLATAAAPSGTIKGMVETSLKSNERGTINKRGETDYPRTEADTTIRKWTGGTSLDESLQKEKIYNDQLNMRSRKAGQKAVTEKAERMLAQGTLTQESMKELVEKYKKEKGDPQQLVNALVEYAKVKNLTTKQRLQGIPSDGLSSIYRFQNYE